MTVEKMNIHKALIELKTVGKRISDEVAGTTFVMSTKHSNQKIGGKPVGDVKASILSAKQKVDDLIRRRNAIKCAVTRSNSETKVTVCGEQYTVAEAIDIKNTGTLYKELLLKKISGDYDRATKMCEMQNADLDRRADDHIKNLFGSAEIKAGVSKEMIAARDSFVEQQTMELIDPCNAVEEMTKLRDEIDRFLSEVDAALSVSNAVTEITVEY